MNPLIRGPLALGTMMFGRWGNTDEAECHRMVDRAIDAGVTLFDTADMYDDGASETILGEALRGRRDGVAIATKVGNPMGGDLTRSGLSRRWIMQACDDSLRRLQVDHIDLYQMHRPDPATPIDETLLALDELVKAGKVGALGTSTFSAGQLRDVQARAAALGVTAPVMEQPPYSILARGIEHEVLPVLHDYGVHALVWAPLNGGWLTGKYQSDDRDGADAASRANRQPDHFDHRNDEIRQQKLRLVDELTRLAADHGMTITQLALAFVVDDPSVTAALVGPRTEPQLEQLLSLGDLRLPDGVRDEIDRLVAPGTNINPADAG